MTASDEIRTERAKKLFLRYGGNRYYMALNGEESEYDRYHVSPETEEAWRREYVTQFLERRRYGRDALAAYAKAADLVKSDWDSGILEKLLFYPLRADGLDDVTILFMLQRSFLLAEKWAKKRKLSLRRTDEYLSAFDTFASGVLERSEAGTLTRAEDYTMREFADPAYTAGFLKDLRERWSGLL